jgi:hypothetical protein
MAQHGPVTGAFDRPLELKPDMPEASRRWEAFFAGDLIDRPLVCVTAPREGAPPAPGLGYRDRVTLPLEEVVERTGAQLEATYYGGEAVPTAWISFGPDEVAAFCGAELKWSEDSGDTNWSEPCVTDWAQFRIALQEDSPLYQRMLALYRGVSHRIAGKGLLGMLDLHTNMDLVSALRGPQRLCLDLLDQPEAIDRAMEEARAVFPVLWDGLWEAGRMDEVGYATATTLQCDFCCMMSPPMFRRWVLPALEEEAAVVGNTVYHWDGPGALVHTADLVASRGLHTLSYVTGTGHGSHVEYIDLLQRVQAGGKAVQVWGTPDELKVLHKALRPEKTYFSTWVSSQAEADALLEWFVQNT